MPTEAQVRECFDLSRAFFKGGAKSQNKTYDAAVNPAKAGDADRIFAIGVLHGLPRDQTVDHVTRGDIMRETGNTLGNCLEATSIAASYVAEKLPDVPMRVANSRGGDHAFLLVGPVPPPLDRPVRRWSELPNQRDGTFVIDVWAGVFCRAREYPALFAAKMQRWQAQGKRIVVRADAETRQLRTAMPLQWGRSVLDSGVRHTDIGVNVDPNINRIVKHTLTRNMEDRHRSALSESTEGQRNATQELQAANDELSYVRTKIDRFVTDAQRTTKEQLTRRIDDLSRHRWSPGERQQRIEAIDGLTNHLDLIMHHREEFLRRALPSDIRADLEDAANQVREAKDELRLRNKELFYLRMQEQRRRPPAPTPQAASQQWPAPSMASSFSSTPRPLQRIARNSAEPSTSENAQIDRSLPSRRR